jgi:hypothetical protein
LIAPRAWSIDGKTCSADQKAVIIKEMQYALEIAQYATQHTDEGPYLDAMFAGTPNFAQTAKTVFGNIANMLDPNNQVYTITITCEPASDMCAGKYPYYAHMKDSTNTMNLCPTFFQDIPDGTERAILTTDQRLAQRNDKDFDIRLAARTRSTVIIHEMTHTKYAMGTQGR